MRPSRSRPWRRDRRRETPHRPRARDPGRDIPRGRNPERRARPRGPAPRTSGETRVRRGNARTPPRLVRPRPENARPSPAEEKERAPPSWPRGPSTPCRAAWPRQRRDRPSVPRAPHLRATSRCAAHARARASRSRGRAASSCPRRVGSRSRGTLPRGSRDAAFRPGERNRSSRSGHPSRRRECCRPFRGGGPARGPSPASRYSRPRPPRRRSARARGTHRALSRHSRRPRPASRSKTEASGSGDPARPTSVRDSPSRGDRATSSGRRVVPRRLREPGSSPRAGRLSPTPRRASPGRRRSTPCRGPARRNRGS